MTHTVRPCLVRLSPPQPATISSPSQWPWQGNGHPRTKGWKSLRPETTARDGEAGEKRKGSPPKAGPGAEILDAEEGAHFQPPSDPYLVRVPRGLQLPEGFTVEHIRTHSCRYSSTRLPPGVPYPETTQHTLLLLTHGHRPARPPVSASPAPGALQSHGTPYLLAPARARTHSPTHARSPRAPFSLAQGDPSF